MLPRKNKIKQKMGVRESSRLRSPSHLAFVRGFACACFKSQECEGKIEAHHVREHGNGGMGLKPDDSDAVPLCALHHSEGHRIGWATFQLKHKVDLKAEAEKLWRVSSARIKAERKEMAR